MSRFNFFALGGIDENGKNCYILEIENSIFVINIGVKVPITSTNGIDTIIPNLQYLEKNKKRIKGVFLTDAKNESFSALPWLLMKIPNLKIYMSTFTKIIVLDRLSKYKIDNKYEIISIPKELKIDNILIKSIPLGGSINGILGFNFEKEDGNILFLSNIVLGNMGIFGKTDINEIKKYLNPNKELTMLCLDSGKSNVSGLAINKAKVTPIIERYFVEAKENERIIIGAFDEEMSTLHEVLNLAAKYNRPVVAYGRNYAYLLSLSIKIFNKQKFPEIIDIKQINEVQNAVVLVTGSVHRLYGRFLRITQKNDVFLKLKNNDNVIIIAPPINGLETTHSLMLDEIARITPKLFDITDSQHYFLRPAKDDIYTIVKQLRPKHFVPIQGLYRYLVVAGQIAAAAFVNKSNIHILQNGKVLNFVNNDLYSQKTTISDVKDVAIDGFGVDDISKEVIREREILAKDGVITISCLLDFKTRELFGDIKIITHGIFDKETKKDAKELIKSIVYFVVKEKGTDNLKEVQEKIRKTVTKKIFKTIDKEPMVVVCFYEV